MTDTTLENADLETNDQPEQHRKSRGRPAGERKPKSTQSGKKEKLSARQLTGIIYLGNSAAASALKAPALEIDEKEAALIADAVVDVLQYYDFEASAKTVAWANLVGTLATVYGLRIWSMMQNGQVSRGTSASFLDDITGD